jgi:two-component system, NtrC family, sensor kinase
MFEGISDRLGWGWERLRLRLNLQTKILVLVAASMLLILFTSSYLHTVRTRAVVEESHYESAISQITVLTDRISRYNYFSSLADLQQEMQLVAGSRPDFKQIDVYKNSATGPQLFATTSPGAPSLDSIGATNWRAVQQGMSSTEITRSNNNYWLVTADISNPQQNGFIQALVLKSTHHELVDSLHREYNLFLFGAVAASVALLYVVFSFFFHRPVREILGTIALTKAGTLAARAPVLRDDELGEIARRFNELMDEIATRTTEREGLLKRIGELNSELRLKVEVATSELRSTSANLIRTQQRLAQSERMAAIGQITASLAHEIGTPLNAVAGHLQLLGRNHRDEPDTQRRLNIINGQLNAIVQTVRSLLDRTSRPGVTFRLIDLNEVVKELVQLVGPMLESRSITAATELETDLPPVMADRDSLHQVFLNLVNNSCDAMPNGGHLEITTRYLSSLQQIEIMFSDCGAGIAPNVVEHLFEPMFTTKQSGSGLGLVIAHDILAQHHGQIELVSGSAGAVFLLTLPVAQVLQPKKEFVEVETNVA